MSQTTFNSWQAIQSEVVRRIQTGEWKPGYPIPNEADLSEEFGCARATVNRALRQLAEEGLLDRKRRAGTRVTLQAARRAKLEISVLRKEIEKKGMEYGYSLILCNTKKPPQLVRASLGSAPREAHLHVVAVHYGNGKPYVHEDRWINLKSAPHAASADFASVSANEWLLDNIPFESGEIAFSATNVKARVAKYLRCNVGDGLFTIDRKTVREGAIVTTVRLTFAPGYAMHAEL